jgi:hypothetical protein
MTKSFPSVRFGQSIGGSLVIGNVAWPHPKGDLHTLREAIWPQFFCQSPLLLFNVEFSPKFSYKIRLPKLFVLYLLSFIFCQSPFLFSMLSFFPSSTTKFACRSFSFYIYCHLFSVTVHSRFSMLSSFPSSPTKFACRSFLYLLSFIFCHSPLLLFNVEFFRQILLQKSLASWLFRSIFTLYISKAEPLIIQILPFLPVMHILLCCTSKRLSLSEIL